MLKAVGFDDEALQQADRRRGQHVDRDWAVQLPPARAGRARQAGHPRSRRHADGVQHRLHLRRHHDGQRRHARLASSAARSSPTRSSSSAAATASTRSSRSAAATRRSRARRWRWRDSTCRAWCSTAESIAPGRFHDHDVTIQDVYEGIGAHAAGKMTDAESEGSRGSRLSGCGRLWRPVHRQHHGDGDRVPRHRADGQRLGPGPRFGQGRSRPPRRPACHGPPQPNLTPRQILTREGDRERDRRGADHAAARPTRCCT